MADFAAALFAAFFAPFFRPVAAFFAAADWAFAASAFCNRHRFFVAAIIRFIPSSLIRRFGFDGSGVAGADGLDSPLIFAHLALCEIAIFRRTAALNFLPLLVGAPDVAVVVVE